MPASEQIRLREIFDSDLPVFYEQQRDPVANELAGFPPRELEPFMAHWAKIRADQTNLMRTILCEGQVAGNIVSFVMDGHQEVGYWLGREFWGRGIATRALEQFLTLIEVRPLYAYVFKGNLASRRVLEKCGFVVCGEERSFSSLRGTEVDGLKLKLA